MHSGPLIPLWAELETPAKSIREKALCIKMLGEYHEGMNGHGGPLVFVSASNLQYVCVCVCMCHWARFKTKNTLFETQGVRERERDEDTHQHVHILARTAKVAKAAKRKMQCPHYRTP